MKLYSPQASVELFHLVLLDLLGRKLDRRAYSLKGGCNLRFFFKSIRYSQDLDLDVNAGFSQKKLQDVMNRIIGSKTIEQILDVRGIRIEERSSPKQTETTQRWKLAISVPGSRALLRTKIEFSRRGMASGLAFDPVDPLLIRMYELSPILMSHYQREEALVQKVVALASRRQIQTRDVFDIYQLLFVGIDPAVVHRMVPEHLEQARNNAWGMSYGMFKSQVVSFLHPDHRAQYSSKEVWDKIILTVVEVLGDPNR